jgi:nucleoside-diphosphate-sugar epimerase
MGEWAMNVAGYHAWIAGGTAQRSFYRGRRVLVTGADGFLGLNCIRALHALDADIAVLSRRAESRARRYASQVFHGDLMDGEVVRAALEGCSVVFDFAGVSGAVDSNRNPIDGLSGECLPQLSLIQACAESESSPLVVYCSTRLVYGRPQYLPVDESHPLLPQSMYAVHKITVENYLRVYHATHGLRYCTFRLSNPYGPYQARDARNYGVINRFIQLAAAGQPITLYGDGQQQRDYVYVDDVIGACLSAVTHECSHNQILNLGGDQPIRLRDAAERISTLAGGTPVRFQPWPEEYRVVETGDYRSDLTKLATCLQPPAQTAFDVGVELTLEFYRQALARTESPVNG